MISRKNSIHDVVIFCEPIEMFDAFAEMLALLARESRFAMISRMLGVVRCLIWFGLCLIFGLVVWFGLELAGLMGLLVAWWGWPLVWATFT